MLGAISLPLDSLSQPGIGSRAIDGSRSTEAAPATIEIPATALVICGSVSLAALAVLMRLAHLSLVVSPDVIVCAVVGFAALVLLGLIASRGVNGQPDAASAFVEYAGLLAFVSLLGVIATYPVAFFSRHFSDPMLESIDQALRFNWVAWYEVVAAHRFLQLLERAFYDSVFVTPLVIAATFAWSRQRSRAHLLIASYWLAVVVTLLLFALFPAKGPLAMSWHGAIPYMPESALDQATIIEALKQHRLHEVRLDALHGLVGAPSFHTTAAMLFIIAAWPIERLRWPVLLVNLLMLASIPVEGTHYLADMIAGIAVALFAQGTMSVLLRRPRAPQRPPSPPRIEPRSPPPPSLPAALRPRWFM